MPKITERTDNDEIIEIAKMTAALEGLDKRIEGLENKIGKAKGPLFGGECAGGVSWNDIETAIRKNRIQGVNTEEDKGLLVAIKTAHRHLEKKHQLRYVDGEERAFSKMAERLDSFSGIPLVGGFFHSHANEYRNEGKAKQQDRLRELGEWVRELEGKYPSFQERVVRRLYGG